jgi:predicted dehydrogenase
MAPIKAVVIGYGMSAKIFHIPFMQALPELFQVYGIVQRTPGEAKETYPDIKHWTSAEEMIKDSEIELVVVTSTPGAHYSQVKAALEAGKHVLCEKPFVPTSEEALELGQLAEEKKLVLTVYQNRRWDSDFLTLRKILDDGTLGRLVEIDTRFDRWRIEPPTAESASWKFKEGPAQGGIFDLGVHLIDQLVVLFGAPQRVSAFLVNHRVYTEKGTGGEIGGDSFTCLLHYDSMGLTATVKSSVASLQVEQLRYWVRGDKGSYIKYNTDVQEDQLKAGAKPGDKDFGLDKSVGTLTTLSGDGMPSQTRVRADDPPATYLEFYKLLHGALVGKSENPVTAEQAATTIKIIETANESAKQERTLNFGA